MSNYKQIIAAANKKHLSSKQYEAYLALRIRATQDYDLAIIDMQKGKAWRMSTNDIVGLEQRVIITAERLQEADKLLRTLPMSFGVWGKKVELACGSRSQSDSMPDTDAFSGSFFAYAAPAGWRRCGPEAVASALLLAGDRRSGVIAAS